MQRPSIEPMPASAAFVRILTLNRYFAWRAADRCLGSSADHLDRARTPVGPQEKAARFPRQLGAPCARCTYRIVNRLRGHPRTVRFDHTTRAGILPPPNRYSTFNRSRIHPEGGTQREDDHALG